MISTITIYATFTKKKIFALTWLTIKKVRLFYVFMNILSNNYRYINYNLFADIFFFVSKRCEILLCRYEISQYMYSDIDFQIDETGFNFSLTPSASTPTGQPTVSTLSGAPPPTPGVHRRR